MTEPAQLLYLEPDDEITSVVRRLREASTERLVLVASGRTRATSSAVALRLLAEVAAEEGRQLALVADPAARSLAAEAGIDAFASVAEASAEGAVPLEPPAPRRAAIHVVRGRGDDTVAALPAATAAAPVGAAPPLPSPPSPQDETLAIPVPRPPSPPGRAREPSRRRRKTLLVGGLVVLALAAAGAAAAIVLPAATIAIAPGTEAIGPIDYVVELTAAGQEERSFSFSADGTATGKHVERPAATGVVTFANYNYTGAVRVPAGTQVSAGGDVFFETTEEVVVPAARVVGLRVRPSEASGEIVAVAGGPSGNVAALAIDTIEDDEIDGQLQAPFPFSSDRRVFNRDPTSDGDVLRTPEVTQRDVDAVVTAITQELRSQARAFLAEDPERVYAPGGRLRPEIEIPDELVGRLDADAEGFELTGTLDLARRYVEADAIREAARQTLLDDPEAAPGRQVLEDTVEVEIGDVEGGDQARVAVTLTADAVADVDLDDVRGRVLGLTRREARDELAPLGGVRVELWPGWVDRVPTLEWRVTVQLEADEGGG